METFSDLLSRYVKRAGISDTELARAIGISRQTVFRWREGLTSRPNSREDVLAIAKKLRLSPDETNTLLLSAGFRPEEPAISPSDLNEDSGPAPIRVEVPQAQESPSPAENETPGVAVKRFKPIVTPFTVAITLVVVVLVTGLIIAVNNWSDWFPETPGASSQNQTSTTTEKGPALTAAPGEVLVLVAPLSDSPFGQSLTRQLADSLNREALGNRLSDFRAVAISDGVTEASKADSLLRDNKAQLIVWGKSESGSLSILLAPAPVQPFTPIILDESSITSEQVKTLSLLVLASISLNQGEREQSLMFLSAAHPLITDAGAGNDPFLSLYNVLSEQASK